MAHVVGKYGLVTMLGCCAPLVLLVAGCAMDSYTDSPPFQKSFDEVWSVTREVIEPYGIEVENKEEGEMESFWHGSAGVFRYEGTRRKICGKIETLEEGGTVSKIMVLQERNSTVPYRGVEEAVEWESDGCDFDMADMIMHRIIMRLSGSQLEAEIRDRFKDRPDLDELDRKIRESRERLKEEEKKSGEK
ncbi:MAG: hypothetical protein RDV41_01610 [Planctomycetota bacterium]|nr:hypothetical protein [Planctomycetota bacterium]